MQSIVQLRKRFFLPPNPGNPEPITAAVDDTIVPENPGACCVFPSTDTGELIPINALDQSVRSNQFLASATLKPIHPTKSHERLTHTQDPISLPLSQEIVCTKRPASTLGEHVNSPSKNGSGGTRWRCPQAGLVKINFDAAVFGASNRFGIGVGIRESNVVVLASFSQEIPQAYKAKEIEALAALNALSFAFELGFRSTILKGDSLGLTQAMKLEEHSLSPTGLLTEDAKMVANSFVRLLYSHIKRNNNGVAHSLAKNALCTKFSSMDGKCPITYCFDFTIGCS